MTSRAADSAAASDHCGPPRNGCAGPLTGGRDPAATATSLQKGADDMVPTLAGRIQTRLALLTVIGGLVTAIVGLWLPVSAPLPPR